jgi:WD40 repeat protein
LTAKQDISLASSLLEKCQERLRGWEWHYMMRLRDGGRLPLAEHRGGLWIAVFSPDGRRIANASIDGTVNIWDAASGELLRKYRGHPGLIAIAGSLLQTFQTDGFQHCEGWRCIVNHNHVNGLPSRILL